jgi:hypothetical protein
MAYLDGVLSRVALVGGTHALGVLDDERHRFFLVHVLPGVQGGGEVLAVQVLRRGDDDRIDRLVFEQAPVVHVRGRCRDDLLGCLQTLGIDIAESSELDTGCRDGPANQLEAAIAGADDTHAHTVIRAEHGGGDSEGTREAGGYFANENAAGLHEGISFILPFTG